jgi:hypothetical protein
MQETCLDLNIKESRGWKAPQQTGHVIMAGPYVIIAGMSYI